MPPRVFPDNPEFKNKAEEEVFKVAYSQLGENDCIFCNLEFSSPSHGDVEIDLLLLLENRGCVVIEVKGGHITFDGFNWIQNDSKGSRPIEPARQAKKNLFAILDYIRNRWSQGNLKSDWIVAFPHSNVPSVNDAQLPDNKIVDKADLGHLLSNIKSNIDSINSIAPVGHLWMTAAITHLTAISSAEADKENFLSENFGFIKELTHERAILLEQISENERYFVRGPAGSGKTWLAFEQAKKWTREGLKVGIVTFNRGISTYMKNKSLELPEEERPFWVGTFHALASMIGATAGAPGDYDENADRFAEGLIAAATSLEAEKKFDAFVVDEAQDFMFSWWKTLDLCLREPGKGKLALFGDDQQKIFGIRRGPEGFFAKVTINDNIRNSKQIGELSAGLTKRSIVVRGPSSFPVEYIICEENHVISTADDEIVRLTEEDNWRPGEIALLTTKSRHPVHAEYKTSELDRYWDEFWSGDSVFYGTVGGFKGLERPIVVLAINGFHNAEDFEDFLYVGVTRARDKLVVVCTSDVRTLIKKEIKNELAG